MEGGFYHDTVSWALEYIGGLFRQLSWGSVLLAAGLLLLTAGLSAVIFLRNLKKAYLNGNGMRLWPHYGLIAAALLMTVCVWSCCARLTLIPAVILGLMTVAGAYGIIRRRSFGVVLAIAVLWSGWLCVAAEALLTVGPDAAELERFSAVGMFAVYAAGDILIMRAVALEVLLCVLTARLAGYYSRGRFILLDRRRRELMSVSRCECGYPALDKQAYCPMCGRAQSGPFSILRIEAADKPDYCKDCGAKLLKGENCPRCGSLKKAMGDKTKETLTGKLKEGIVALAVIAVLLVPQLGPGLVSGLNGGAESAKSAFAEAAAAYLDDPAVRADAGWQQEFTAAYDALYDVDIRMFDVRLRRLPENDLPFYINYCESAYLRQITMEQMWEAVKTDDPEAFAALAPVYDETLRTQRQALTDRLSQAASFSEDRIGAFLLILVNGFRFYASFCSLYLLGGAALLLGLLLSGLAWSLVRRSPVRREGIFVQMARSEGAVPQKKKKTSGATVAATVGILALILSLAALGMALREPEEPGYDDLLKEAVLDAGAPVLNALASEDDGLAEAARTQLAGLAALSVSPRPEELGAVYDAIQALLPPMEEALQAMVKTGGCSPELRAQYIDAELQALELTGRVLTDSAIDAVKELFA